MSRSSNSRLVRGLVSIAGLLMASFIVVVMLAALGILYALSGVDDRPFVNEKRLPSPAPTFSGRF
jgi:hypothetical protein